MIKSGKFQISLVIPLGLFFLFLPFFSLSAQQKKFDVDGELRLHSPDSGPESGRFRSAVMLVPRVNAPSGSCDSGTLAYCSADKRLYGCRSGIWQPLGSGASADKYEATRIVAAYDSIGSNNGGANCEVGGACTNLRADYTCDGSDDQYIINRAINELPSTGGMVYLLEGTYNISQYSQGAPLQEGPGIRLDRNNITLMGSGRNTVLRVYTSGFAAPSWLEVITIPAGHISVIQDILITQLTIDGVNKNGSDNKGIALNGGAAGIKNVKIDKVWVKDIDGDGIGIFSNAENIAVTDSFIQDNAAYGINTLCGSAGENNSRIYIAGNSIRGNGVLGVRISGPNNTEVLIQKNNIYNNVRSGIGLCQASYSTVRANNINNNGTGGVCVDDWGGCDGIFIDYMNAPGYAKVGYDLDNTLICENNIKSNKGRGIRLARDVHHILISRNNIIDNQEQGIYLYNSSHNFITGNMIRNNGRSGSGAGKRGIDIDTASNYTHISENYFAAISGVSGQYGIYFRDNGSGISNNYIFANKIHGYSSGMSSYSLYNANTEETDWQNHGTLFTDPLGLSMEAITLNFDGSSWGVQPGIHSASYIKLDGQGGRLQLGNGRTKGDILILECISADNIFRVDNYSNANLSYNIDLALDDNLTLIWDGQIWTQIGHADN